MAYHFFIIINDGESEKSVQSLRGYEIPERGLRNPQISCLRPLNLRRPPLTIVNLYLNKFFKMPAILKERSQSIYSYKKMKIPRTIDYDNSLWYFGSELSVWSGQEHGKIYQHPDIKCNRVHLSPRIRRDLRLQGIQNIPCNMTYLFPCDCVILRERNGYLHFWLCIFMLFWFMVLMTSRLF